MNDFISITEIMKILEVPNLTLSRDLGTKFHNTHDECALQIKAAIQLARILKKNNLTYNFANGFLAEECELINKYVNSPNSSLIES
jgi:heterodisulfide reductase subunit B